MGVFSFIADLVKGAAAFFGWKEKQQELKNSPELRANAEAEIRQRAAERAAREVAEGDLERIRKDAGES